MKRITLRYIIMTTFLSSALYGAAEADTKKALTAKIGVVDTQAIVPMDPSVLSKGSKQWQDSFVKFQGQLAQVDDELKKLEEKYTEAGKKFQTLQKSGVASRETLEREYEPLMRMEYELRTQMEQRQNYVQNELAKLQSQIWPKLEEAMEEIRKAQGWDMLLVRGSAVLSFDKKFDVTDAVLALLNKRYEAEQKDKAKKESTEKAENA